MLIVTTMLLNKKRFQSYSVQTGDSGEDKCDMTFRIGGFSRYFLSLLSTSNPFLVV